MNDRVANVMAADFTSERADDDAMPDIKMIDAVERARYSSRR
jgi:hypothetical protein